MGREEMLTFEGSGRDGVPASARGEVFPIVNCEDLQATKAFYVQVFGGQLSYESSMRVGRST